jgi:predicted nuclease of restriction endonuclease-like (RecB) superfamily
MEVDFVKTKLTVTNAKLNQEELVLETAEGIEGLVPRGQMLVDSDNLSFIYLMEKDEEYTYISLPEQLWGELKQGFGQQHKVYLQFEGSRVELENFYSELEYLIENIKGNGNYGDEMVSRVESIF